MKKSLLLLVAVAALLPLSGCIVRARHRPAVVTYSGSAQVGYASPGVVVYQPPPPAQVTVSATPVAPYQGAIWVQPHWQWNGAQYVWVDGYWEQPRAGYVYVQPTWQRRGNGYVYVQGAWQPHRGAAVRVNTRPVVRPRATVQVRTAPVRGPATVRVRGGGRATVRVR
jgi:hypothetical protein